MAFYHNHTRSDVVVTLRLTAATDPAAALKLGLESALRPCSLKLGIHDLVVPPGAIIELADGTSADFLASRRA